MIKKIQKERANAVQRYLAGESPESICAALGKKQHDGCINGCHGIPMMIQRGVKDILGDRFTEPLPYSC